MSSGSANVKQRSAPPREQVQRVDAAPWITFLHLTGDEEGARQENVYDVEMACHSCRRAALVRFSMSSIAVAPTPLRAGEIDSVRDRFVAAHAKCTPPTDPLAWTWEREGERELYDFSIGVS